MACLVGCLALSAPRVAIVLVVIFSDYIGAAYRTTMWPVLGFLFMPATTLAYAWSIHRYGEVHDWGLFLVILAVLIDLGLLGAGSNSGRRYRRQRNGA